MIWRPFFARVKGNHRRVYSRILGVPLAWQPGWLKTELKKWFLFILKNPDQILKIIISPDSTFILFCKGFITTDARTKDFRKTLL